MPQSDAVDAALDACRAAFSRAPYPPLARRKERIRALANAAVANRQKMRDALRADYCHHPDTQTDFIECAAVSARCHQAIEHLEVWAAPDLRPLDAAMFGTASAWMAWQPKGVVGNIVPWNFPFEIGLSTVAEMLAAGNRIVLKPSELAPACAELVREIVAATFDADEVTTVLGGPDIAEAFAAAPWDHLMFTGSTTNGKRVMALAASNLTPLTLELGGKCPALLASGGVNARTVQSLVGLKLAKSGQICVSVDHVLVPRADLDAFVAMTRDHCDATLAGFSAGPSATGIISARHYERIAALLADARDHGATIVDLDDCGDDPAGRRMPLRLVVDPPAAARVRHEEVFGPLLPVIPYDGLDDAIAMINAAGAPLGIYVFGDDQAEIDAVTLRTRSGGVTVNGAALHSAPPNMGFGGVGASGFGRTHGIEGFRSFSNQRAMFVRGPADAVDMIFPPYGPEQAAIADAAFA